MNKRIDLGIFPFFERKNHIVKLQHINISQSEQFLTFDLVFMALQSQNLSFSKFFYSFSAIFKRMLKSEIFLNFFSLFS